MRSLTFKLTAAFLLISLAAIGLAAALVWAATAIEFNRYVLDQRQSSFVAVSKAYYEANGSWAGVPQALQRQGLLPPPIQPGSGQPLPQPPPFALVNRDGVVIVAGGPFRFDQRLTPATLAQGVPIEVNGAVVGTVMFTGQAPVRTAIEEKYLGRITQALWLAALGGVLIALILGMVVARTLTRPVRELTAATRQLAKGNLERPVAVRSQDELGKLTTAFNQMSADLAHSNQLRRQMTADIAHDLRNPLTVMSGYVEALRDGVLPPTRERFEVMHGEMQHLTRLVDDLRTLSLADAGELSMQPRPTPPLALLEELAGAYQYRARQRNIALTAEAAPDLPLVNVDPERMEQVLGNLVSNALRYTPDGGQIALAARRVAGGVELSVRDNGAGMPSEVASHVFERFYQGDESRQGQAGESGLGLATAKSIAELHGGTIAAHSDGVGKGSVFAVTVPVV